MTSISIDNDGVRIRARWKWVEKVSAKLSMAGPQTAKQLDGSVWWSVSYTDITEILVAARTMIIKSNNGDARVGTFTSKGLKLMAEELSRLGVPYTKVNSTIGKTFEMRSGPVEGL